MTLRGEGVMAVMQSFQTVLALWLSATFHDTSKKGKGGGPEVKSHNLKKI